MLGRFCDNRNPRRIARLSDTALQRPMGLLRDRTRSERDPSRSVRTLRDLAFWREKLDSKPAFGFKQVFSEFRLSRSGRNDAAIRGPHCSELAIQRPARFGFAPVGGDVGIAAKLQQIFPGQPQQQAQRRDNQQEHHAQ